MAASLDYTEPPRLLSRPCLEPAPNHLRSRDEAQAPADIHREALYRCLSAGLERVAPDIARSFPAASLTLVAWTYRFYGEHRDIELDRPGIERILAAPEPTAEDVREIESLAIRIARLLRVAGDALPLFGRLIAKPSMRLSVAEVHRYFQDRRGVATAVRAQLRHALTDAWSAGERVLLIGHSLGSVIAYDTLWELSHERPEPGHVELFITLGSPLGSRLILRGCGAHAAPGANATLRTSSAGRTFPRGAS